YALRQRRISMTYDPFQAYATLGGYPGINNPFQTPFNFNGMQNPAINPTAAWNPFAAYQPQQAYWQNPLLLAGLQQGGLQQGGLQQGGQQQGGFQQGGYPQSGFQQGGLQQGGLQQGISPHALLQQLA